MTSNDSNNNLKIGKLPELEVVELRDLVFHEDPDQQRLEKLINRLNSEKILKNPPIVARMQGYDKLVILDGANRTAALKALGVNHIVVQTVDLEDDLLSIQCWHHAVEKLDRSYFMIKLSKIDGIKMTERESFFENSSMRQKLTDEKDYLCRIIFRDDSVLAIKGSENIRDQIKQLNEISSLYLKTTYSDRVSYIDLDNLRAHYPAFQSLVTFKNLSKDDFRQIVESGLKLPAGVTRLFLPNERLD